MNTSEVGWFKHRDEQIGFLNAYQPIVDTEKNAIFAFEALARSETGGSVAGLFSKVDKALFPQFDHTVREMALQRAVALGLDNKLTLNIDTQSLIHPADYLGQILDLAEALSFPMDNLVIELCESDVIHGIADLSNRLRDIHSRGALVALDDFGAGYAGLNALIDVNPDIIKLDSYIVRDIGNNGTRQSVVRALVTLSDEMGIDLVAEGVETQVELSVLQDLGVCLFQGFLFARPGVCCLPVPQFDHFA